MQVNFDPNQINFKNLLTQRNEKQTLWLDSLEEEKTIIIQNLTEKIYHQIINHLEITTPNPKYHLYSDNAPLLTKYFFNIRTKKITSFFWDSLPKNSWFQKALEINPEEEPNQTTKCLSPILPRINNKMITHFMDSIGKQTKKNLKSQFYNIASNHGNHFFRFSVKWQGSRSQESSEEFQLSVKVWFENLDTSKN